MPESGSHRRYDAQFKWHKANCADLGVFLFLPGPIAFYGFSPENQQSKGEQHPLGLHGYGLPSLCWTKE
jgi:hypothetical protein